MRKKEQLLWDAMKRNLPRSIWLQRVENLVGSGMPDLFVASDNGTCWIELKAVDRPARPTTPLLGSDGLRQSQINWHIKASRHGIKTHVLVRDDHGVLYLFPPGALNVNDIPVETALARYKTDWNELGVKL